MLQKLDRLARIRENQRRSRARKQEYIRELEQKLATCKSQAHQRDVEHRLAVQRLENENRKLKDLLLGGFGIGAGDLEGYLRMGDDPAMDQKVAIPALRQGSGIMGRGGGGVGEVEEGSNSRSSSCLPVSYSRSSMNKKKSVCPAPRPRPVLRGSSNRCSESGERLEEEEYSTADSRNFQQEHHHHHHHQQEAPVTVTTDSIDSTEKTLPQQLQQKLPEQGSQLSQLLSPQEESVCGCPPDQAIDSWPAQEDILNTTLCAIAEDLIQQYNTRGVDMKEIQKKLWIGFRKGLAAGEGCRVQNQVLFQVLDEISGNV